MAQGTRDNSPEQRLLWLEQMVARREQLINDLKDEHARLTNQVNMLSAHRAANQMVGLVKGVVAGDDPGKPAMIDNKGNVNVKLDAGPVFSEVMVPWLMDQGGIQFMPRQGQAVYLGFVNDADRPGRMTPVLMGFDAAEGDMIPFAHFVSDEDPTEATSIPLNGPPTPRTQTGRLSQALINTKAPLPAPAPKNAARSYSLTKRIRKACPWAARATFICGPAKTAISWSKKTATGLWPGLQPSRAVKGARALFTALTP